MARYVRVAEAIKQEVGNIIHDELKDPRLGFVTITAVEITQDLRYAKIFFSVLGKEDEQLKTKEALDSALGFIRRLIAQRIRLRFAPEIVFKEDKTSAYSARIQEVLEEINQLNQVKLPYEKKVAVNLRKAGRGGTRKSRRVHKKK